MTNELDKQIINVCGWCGARECAMDKCRIHELYSSKEQECEELRKQWDFSVAHKIILEKDYKAELDELKAMQKDLSFENQKFCYQIEELTKQLDQLKRQHEGDKGLITATGKMNYQLLQEYDKLKTERDSYIDKYFLESQTVVNLRKVLTEIKEIVKIEACDALDGCIFCSNYHDCLNRVILQKISEWEVIYE